MDNTELVTAFIKNYRDLQLDKSNHDQIKDFNKSLKKYPYFLVHPFIVDDNEPDNVQLLVGFANHFKIYQKNDKSTIPEAMGQICGMQHFLKADKSFNITETLVIPTGTIDPMPIRKIEWIELINAPKLDDGEFSILTTAFLEYFGLDVRAEQAGSSKSFDFNQYFFNEKNKPVDLELREVWRDTDSDEKYGHIQTLVIWQGEFIGWLLCSGKWLDSYTAYTVNLTRWSELMDCIYQQSGYVPGRGQNGVYVYDMNKDDVDDVAYVPGISTLNYTD